MYLCFKNDTFTFNKQACYTAIKFEIEIGMKRLS